MKLTLCNEVLCPMPLREQCNFASSLGYDGLEIAPFTLTEDPTALSARDLGAIRHTVEDCGLSVRSLHWLALAPKGIDLTAIDAETIRRSREAMLKIVDLGAALGARVLVLGSPAQRRLGKNPVQQRARFIDHVAALAARAHAAGLVCCIEAINRGECNFINRLDQVQAIIDEIGDPALKVMIDVSHAAQEESRSLSDLARHYIGIGSLAHVQLNAINRRAPGQSTDAEGRDDIADLISTLIALGYDGDCAMEPLDYVPDGPSCAAFAIGYVKGLMRSR